MANYRVIYSDTLFHEADLSGALRRKQEINARMRENVNRKSSREELQRSINDLKKKISKVEDAIESLSKFPSSGSSNKFSFLKAKENELADLKKELEEKQKLLSQIPSDDTSYVTRNSTSKGGGSNIVGRRTTKVH